MVQFRRIPNSKGIVEVGKTEGHVRTDPATAGIHTGTHRDIHTHTCTLPPESTQE